MNKTSLNQNSATPPLSDELYEFIGAIIGDGCVSGFKKKSGKSNYHISITGDSRFDKDYLTKKIPRLVQLLFGVKANPSFRKNILNFNQRVWFCARE